MPPILSVWIFSFEMNEARLKFYIVIFENLSSVLCSRYDKSLLPLLCCFEKIHHH